MKILQISALVPYPPDDGGRVGIYNLTRQYLRRGVEVHFAAPRARANDAENFGKQLPLHFFDVDPRNSLLGGFRNLFSDIPYNIEKYHRRRALEQICALEEQEHFDAVHVDYLNLAWYGIELKKRYAVPLLLREHNYQSEIFERLRDTARNPLVRWYAGLQHRRMLAYERETIEQVDLVMAISDRDLAKLRELTTSFRARIVPAGVDAARFTPRPHQAHGAVLLWTNYDWLPNRDSVEFFSQKILPPLRGLVPGVRVLLAGKLTEGLPSKKRTEEMEVFGFVPDPNSLTMLASVAVVPLRIGGGIRIKLLELMAMGFAVVSTTVGAQGIQVTPGEDIMLADDPEEFAGAIARLLRSPAESQRIGANARRLVQERYSWDAVGDQLYDALVSVTRTGEAQRMERPL